GREGDPCREGRRRGEDAPPHHHECRATCQLVPRPARPAGAGRRRGAMSEQADVVLRPEEWDELIATLEEREQALSVVGAERDEADRKFERCYDAYEQMLRERDAARAEAERLRAALEEIRS